MTTTDTTPAAAPPACADFEEFARPVRARYAEMAKDELFVTDAGHALFDAYLAAFPAGTDPVFRTQSTHNCNTCKSFVRRLGGLVTIKGGVVTTVWGGLVLPEPYNTVAKALDAAVRAAKVVGVFRSKEAGYGEPHNYDPKTNERYTHFHGGVADRHRAADPGPGPGSSSRSGRSWSGASSSSRRPTSYRSST